MLARFTELTARVRRSAFALPAAIAAAVLMVVISEFAYHGAELRLTRVSNMVNARYHLMQLLRRLTEAETSKRGYILTNGSEYLEPYRNARRDVQNNLKRLADYYLATGDELAEQRRQRVARLVETKLGEMEETMRLFDAGRRDDAMSLVATGIGRETMDDLRAEIDRLVVHQNEVIGRGEASVRHTLMLNRVGVAATTAISLLVVVLLLRQGQALDKQRATRQAEIAAERDRLEREVALRTAELTELASHLQTAREDERARLARELHDELGALLTAAKLDVARIRPRLQQTLPELLPRLAHLTESLNGGIALKRRIIEDLRPSTLDSLGLVPALEILCNEFAQRSGVHMHTELRPVRLARGTELTVFRLVQESLTNMAKYAQAKQAWVRLAVEGEEAVVSVRDDGAGFDTALSQAGRHGLVGMRFRIEAVHGCLSVQSEPGRGTTVSARLPLAPAETTSA